MGNDKALILAEMAVLITGTIAVHRSRGEAWIDIFRVTALRAAIGTLILAMILLTMADLGAGGIAAMFGGLVIVGYLLTTIGVLGPAMLQLENAALGYTAKAKGAEQTGGQFPHAPAPRNIP